MFPRLAPKGEARTPAAARSGQALGHVSQLLEFWLITGYIERGGMCDYDPEDKTR